MKAEDRWRPSKFVRRGSRLTVGPEAGSGSWLITRLVAEAYQRHLPDHARGRLIDLGCGQVPLYAAYRELVDEIVCVDWAGSPHALLHVDVAHDLNEALPFPARVFDTVILSDVLEHVREPSRLLAETRRILAPGGKLLLNVPFLYWLHEEPHDYYRYTEHCLRHLLQQAGLRELLIEPLGGGLEVVADVAAKHLDALPLVGPSAGALLQRGAFFAARLAAARVLLEASRERFPLAYFLVAENSTDAPPALPV
jgi:SAM-dependent methyltransferase